MTRLWDLRSIEDVFMRAALDDYDWIKALDKLADETESAGACVIPIEGRNPLGPVSERIGHIHQKYISEGWIKCDERYRGVPKLNRTRVCTDLDFTTPETMAKHAYWQEFLAPHRLKWWGGIKTKFGDDAWCVSLQRSANSLPFTQDECASLARLALRLDTIGAISNAIGTVRSRASLEAFQTSGKPAILLDRFARVLMMNAPAEALLGSDLCVIDKRIISRDRQTTASIDRAVRSTLWSTEVSVASPPILAPRANGRPIVIYIAGLPQLTSSAFSPCQAIAILSDLAEKESPLDSLLRQTFRLTKAEIRLATNISDGHSLSDYVDEHGLSKETLKAQLRSIFHKTDTHRQAELAALVARLRSGPILTPNG